MKWCCKHTVLCHCASICMSDTLRELVLPSSGSEGLLHQLITWSLEAEMYRDFISYLFFACLFLHGIARGRSISQHALGSTLKVPVSRMVYTVSGSVTHTAVVVGPTYVETDRNIRMRVKVRSTMSSHILSERPLLQICIQWHSERDQHSLVLPSSSSFISFWPLWGSWEMCYDVRVGVSTS